MRSVIIIFCFLALYFGLLALVGLKWAFISFAVLLSLLATAFLLKKNFYISYVTAVNPKYALLYNDKSESFRKNHRIIDMILFYVLSMLLLSAGFMAGDNVFPLQGFDLSRIIIMIAVSILLSLALWLGSLLILKKSKTNYVFWLCFVGLILLGALLIGVLFIQQI
jgi:hypothetical protein